MGSCPPTIAPLECVFSVTSAPALHLPRCRAAAPSRVVTGGAKLEVDLRIIHTVLNERLVDFGRFAEAVRRAIGEGEAGFACAKGASIQAVRSCGPK